MCANFSSVTSEAVENSFRSFSGKMDQQIMSELEKASEVVMVGKQDCLAK